MSPKKKTSPENASANLHLRLPPEEKKAFVKAAKASKFDLTTWARLGLRKLAGLDK